MTDDIEAYLEDAPARHREILDRARSMIGDTAPTVEERIKWHNLVFVVQGTDRIYLATFDEHVNLGFFHGSELADPAGLLEGTGTQMRHIKLTHKDDLTDQAIRALIEQAVRA